MTGSKPTSTSRQPDRPTAPEGVVNICAEAIRAAFARSRNGGGARRWEGGGAKYPSSPPIVTKRKGRQQRKMTGYFVRVFFLEPPDRNTSFDLTCLRGFSGEALHLLARGAGGGEDAPYDVTRSAPLERPGTPDTPRSGDDGRGACVPLLVGIEPTRNPLPGIHENEKNRRGSQGVFLRGREESLISSILHRK